MTQVERLPAGNGTKLPFIARVNGEMLRNASGVARRFKTEEAAERAIETALRPKRIKYTVHGLNSETAKFSSLRHALLFAVARSEEMPANLIEVSAKDGLAGQYEGGKPTPEFVQHHINGIFR